MSGQGGAIRFVPEGERDAGQRREWWRAQAMQAVLAPVLGTQPLFARLLRAALSSARSTEAGFWLPNVYALRRFGGGLELEVAADSLRHTLLDGVEVGGRRLHTGHWFIGAGDWAPILWSLARHQVSGEAVELLAVDLRFRDTAAYGRYRRRAEDGMPMVRNRVVLDSAERVDGYFEAFVRLFESIRDNGLQRRARWARSDYSRPVQRRWAAEWREQDIGVALMADGRLCKLPGGQHRFAIARALGLRQVPVQLRLLHVDALEPYSAEQLIELLDERRIRDLCTAQ